MDLFDKCSLFTTANDFRDAGLYPYFIPLTNNEGSEARIGDHHLIMIGSNNYLGLTVHPKVRQAAKDAIETYGTSCTGSRFLNGTLELHLELERRLAKWVGKERALVFSTGYQVNVGTISAIVARDDFVITDKDDHASIVDGCRLSFGTMRRFPHNDMARLERVLSSLPEQGGRLVVVDGVYSMGGDIAPLPELIEVCKKYGARLMVDDAHSIGILGGGRGTAAEFGVTDDVDLIMGTFSKSFASLGGFIAGDDGIIDYIQHHARSLIFSASIPPANAAAAMAALEVMQAGTGARHALGRDRCVYAQALPRVGLQHRHQRDAHHPRRHRRGYEGAAILEGAFRCGRLYERGASACRAAEPDAAAHQLYGDAHRRAVGEGVGRV